MSLTRQFVEAKLVIRLCVTIHIFDDDSFSRSHKIPFHDSPYSSRLSFIHYTRLMSILHTNAGFNKILQNTHLAFAYTFILYILYVVSYYHLIYYLGLSFTTRDSETTLYPAIACRILVWPLK